MSEKPTELRDRRWLVWLCLVLACLAPPIILILLSRSLLPSNLLSSIAAPGVMQSETPVVLAGLMSDMVNFAIGLIIAGWFVYRRPVISRAQLMNLIVVVLATVSGLASIFAGLRGQYALAFLISSQEFQLGQISGFIEAQAAFLMLQLMMICLLGSHFLIFRDRRSSLTE